jgi:hypothetical protein
VSPHFATENGELLPGAMISANCEFSAKFGRENDCRVDADPDSAKNENRHGVKLITEDLSMRLKLVNIRSNKIARQRTYRN